MELKLKMATESMAVARHLFIYLKRNGKPREMPRPLALTGTTVQSETLHEMTIQKYNVKSVTEH